MRPHSRCLIAPPCMLFGASSVLSVFSSAPAPVIAKQPPRFPKTRFSKSRFQKPHRAFSFVTSPRSRSQDWRNPLGRYSTWCIHTDNEEVDTYTGNEEVDTLHARNLPCIGTCLPSPPTEVDKYTHESCNVEVDIHIHESCHI